MSFQEQVVNNGLAKRMIENGVVLSRNNIERYDISTRVIYVPKKWGSPTGSEPTGSELTGSEPSGSEPSGSEHTKKKKKNYKWWERKWGNDAKCAITHVRIRPGKRTVTTSCGHRFYTTAFLKWYERHPSCPMCRTHLENKDITYKF